MYNTIFIAAIFIGDKQRNLSTYTGPMDFSCEYAYERVGVIKKSCHFFQLRLNSLTTNNVTLALRTIVQGSAWPAGTHRPIHLLHGPIEC